MSLVTYGSPLIGNFALFPPCVKRIGAGREWRTDQPKNDSAEVFNSRWDSARWRFSLAGAEIAGPDVDQWDAFVDCIEGAADPFLFWLKSRRFELRQELIGTGDGSKTAFALQKSRLYPYGPQTTPKIERVRFPIHGYPALKYSNGLEALETEWVRVWLDEVELPPGLFAVHREGGIIVFPEPVPPGVRVRVSCRFMVLVHGQDWMPVEAEASAGAWEFGAGAELVQAAGEEAELFEALELELLGGVYAS